MEIRVTLRSPHGYGEQEHLLCVPDEEIVKLAVKLGLIKYEPCHVCNDTGWVMIGNSPQHCGQCKRWA